jgi:hypothetical protein
LLFLVDASSSMSYNWHGKDNRLNAAAKIVTAIMDSMYAINNEVEFALRVYGSEYPAQYKNCTDTRLEIPFNLQNADLLSTRLQSIEPRGSSPIAYSLQQAAENELKDYLKYDYSFICATFKQLIEKRIKVDPYIIGLDTNTNLISYYECLGQYVGVTKPGHIAEAVSLIVNNNRKLLEKPTTLNLNTTFSNSKPLPQAETLSFEAKLIQLNIIPKIDRRQLPVIYTQRMLFAIKQAYPIKLPSFTPPEAIKDNLTYVVLKPLQPLRQAILTAPKIAGTKKYNKKISIPTSLLAEPEIVGMADITSKQVQPFATKTLSTKTIKTKYNITKITLPKSIIVEPEMPVVNMQYLVIGTLKPISTKAIASKTYKSKYTTTKPYLPKEVIAEPAEEPIVTMSRKANRPMPMNGMITLKDVSIKRKYVLSPLKMIEPDITVKMSYAFPMQFRINYNYHPFPEKIYTRYKRRKGVEFPEKFIVKTAPTIPAKPPVIATNKPEEVKDYKVTTEEATTTQIAVYFTDGAGKFYKNKPDIALVDPVTQKTVIKFMRDILPNSGGEPEPVDLSIEGTYDLTILGQRDIVLRNLKIQKNKLNKVIVKVTQGTLVFSYQGNRSRPVNHKANVFKRFDKNKTTPVAMMCTEQKLFDPGDYYVELDILPNQAYATEISFGAVTEIQIPQEGLMSITNTTNLGDVILFYEHGDQFETFFTMPVYGNASKQSLYLAPGRYKASYKDPARPKLSPPIIVPFVIRANQETKLELQEVNGKEVGPEGIGTPLYENNAPGIKIISDKK